VGVNERTARDWEHGVRKLANGRIYADGRAVDYATGRITMVSVDEPDVRVLERRLHPRFLSIDERERIADLVRAGASLREIGRQLGRPASTVKRELDQRRDVNGWYRPYAAHRHAARRRARPKPARLVTVAVKLNRRPRKTLGWETPAQRLAYAHAKERDASGVAVTP
jgi:hypothetical protein